MLGRRGSPSIIAAAAVALAACVAVVASCTADTPTPPALPSPTPAPTATAVPVPTVAPTRTPESIATSAPAPTPTPLPTATSTPTPSPTAVPTYAPTPTGTSTPTPTITETSTPSPTAEPTAEDAAALIAFSAATGGHNWFNNANWGSDAPLWEWYGVETDELGRVVALELEYNNLNGPIPPEIGELTRLERLQLTGNGLEGWLPVQLGLLVNLRELRLGENLLAGDVPAELADMPMLSILDLSFNQLSGAIPVGLGSAQQLVLVVLRGNSFTGCVPGALGEIEDNDVGSLELPFCSPTRFEAANRAALVALYEATNGEGWHNNEGWLLDMPLDQWHGVFTDYLGNVTDLILLENNLNGTIPPEIGRLAELRTLDLRGNALTGGIPSELGGLVNLYLLDLRDNMLSGAIPATLAELPRLEALFVGSNSLTGCIPTGLKPPDGLPHVITWNINEDPLPYCDASDLVTPTVAPTPGPLPTPNPDLPQDTLALISLYDSTGGPNWKDNTNWRTDAPVSTWFGVQTDSQGHVIQLELSYNGLTGPIPPELSNMSEIGSINLQGNRLSGTIPPEFAQMSRLYGLNLAGNLLEGNIPEGLEQLEYLANLDVSNNRLSGEVSDWPTNLASLSQLRISDNDFSGCVPDELREIDDNDFVYSRLSYCGDPPKQEPVSPAFVEWVIGDDVSRSEERAARLGFQWLYEYGISLGWPIAGETITIVLDDELGLARTLTNEDGLVEPGEFEDHLGFIRTVGGFADDDVNYNRASSLGEPVNHGTTATTVAHENLHIMFQRDLVGHNSTRHDDWSEPHWWGEGMATLFAAVVVRDGMPFGEWRRFLVETAAADRCNAPLADYEIADTHDLFLCGYEVGALAVELLGSKVGFRDIVRVYTDRQPGWTWQQTFEDALGMTLQQFYAEFAQHRRAGFPAVPHPVTVPDR